MTAWWCVLTESWRRYVLDYEGNGGFGPVSVWENGQLVHPIARDRIDGTDCQTRPQPAARRACGRPRAPTSAAPSRAAARACRSCSQPRRHLPAPCSQPRRRLPGVPPGRVAGACPGDGRGLLAMTSV